jgi:hypothetical protein
VKLSNYAFKNSNGIQFEDVTRSWGFEKPSFANGAAYADLDNDGDLDIVINNINEEASVYENSLNDNTGKNNSHALTVKIQGSRPNINGIGASLRIYYAGRQQLYEHQPTRGYLSTNDARAHFGVRCCYAA